MIQKKQRLTELYLDGIIERSEFDRRKNEIVPFSSCPQFFPASGSFPVSAFHIRWPKYWSFSFSPSNEYSGLISFRINWFDLLAVQGTLKSLLQHHNLKALILRHSASFMVQLSHLYMTTGGAALRWRRNRTGRPLSPLQIYQKFLRTLENCFTESNVAHRI